MERLTVATMMLCRDSVKVELVERPTSVGLSFYVAMYGVAVS